MQTCDQIIRHSITTNYFSPLLSFPLYKAPSIKHRIDNISNSDILFALFTRIRPCVLPQPCRVPPNPGSLTKRLWLDIHRVSLGAISISKPKISRFSRHGREKDSFLHLTATKLRQSAAPLRFPTNLESRLATSSSVAHQPCFFPLVHSF